MPNQPVVSVILPAFNRPESTLEAVDSVKAQTYPAVELIVVDDGSTDGTHDALCKKTGFRYIRLARNPEQTPFPGPLGGELKTGGARGVAAARNEGARAASGMFLAFLDSDDLWMPEKIEKQVRFFGAHPDLKIAQTEERWLRRGQRVNPRPVHKKKAGDLFTESLSRCMISPSAVMLERKFFDAFGGFDERFPVCEDYELWLRITAHHPVGLLDEPLTIKRGGGPDQLSRQHSLDYYRILAIDKWLGMAAPLPPERTSKEIPLSPDARNEIRGYALSKTHPPESRRADAIAELERKCAIYVSGCRKRNRTAEADYIESLPALWKNNDPFATMTS